MGDNPEKEYLAQQAEERHRFKIRKMRKRLEILSDMRRTVGLGEHDAATLVDRAICEYLQVAEELLELVVKAEKNT